MNNATSAPRRLFNRKQLQQIIPVCDKTIYNMEKRGEFPKRFAITPRLVAWDAEEVEAWLGARKVAGEKIQAPGVKQ